MKNHFRLFFTCVILLFVVIEAQAQKKNMIKHDSKFVHFGITMGVNNSQFAITRSADFAFHDSIKVVDSPRSPGFNVGIISALHVGNHGEVRFVPTLVFAEKDLRYTEYNIEGDMNTNKTVESIIINFPLSYKYKSDRFFNNFRFYVLGGGRFDWDLASNSKARKALDIVKIDRFDVAAEVGLGLEFYFPMFIFAPEIRISHGLLNTHVPTNNLRYSEVLQRLRSKYITISLQFEG